MNPFINSFSEINMNFINSSKKIDIFKKLVFIHAPKCGGIYVSSILNHLKIQNNGHNQAVINDDCIYFTVIRNPIERFESLLNYRLGEKYFRCVFPEHLRYVYDNQNITLNEIVYNMSSCEMLNFSPYKTLKYWTTNIDIVITLNQLHEMLNYFGYEYDINLFEALNISNKTRGILNEKCKDKIKQAFSEDVELYNKIIKL